MFRFLFLFSLIPVPALSFFGSPAWAISSRFNVDSDGWSVESRNLQNDFVLEGVSIVPYESAGAGHLSITDPTSFSDFFAASVARPLALHCPETTFSAGSTGTQ